MNRTATFATTALLALGLTLSTSAQAASPEAAALAAKGQAQLEAQVTAVVEAFHAASTAGDIDAIESFISSSDDVFFMGSDATEIFIGHDAIVQWWADLFAFFAGYGYTGLEVVSDGSLIQVNRAGGVVLAADEALWRFNNGDLAFRLTLVLRKEGGQWKILHGHFSNPLPNDSLPL